MISAKAIAITKKTSVHVSGDETQGMYYSYTTSCDSSSLSTLSAASIALFAELAKKRQFFGSIGSTIVYEEPASLSPRQPPPLRSNSTTSQSSSITCTDLNLSPTSMHPSPKRPTNSVSYNVTANGILFYKSHIPIPPPTCISTYMACAPDDLESPLAATAHAVEQGTPVANSLARQHLIELTSSSSSTSTTGAMKQFPGLQHTRYLEEQQQVSLDQIIQTPHNDPHNTPQPETGFWSRSFSSSSSVTSISTFEPARFHLTDKSSTSAKVPLFVEPENIDHTKNGTRQRRKNQVLPLFRSQYHVPYPEIPSKTATVDSSGLFGRTLLSINHWLHQQTPSHALDNDGLILDPSSWKQHIKARFARFIDDMKSDPHDFAGKKVVVIGVHGWFPMKLVRSIIGESTGTSTKFCEQMVAAVKNYFCQEHGLSISDTTITSIPLAGEGKVEERVNTLYRNLVQCTAWLEAVSSADVILWATHSQGAPVSTLLIHRLLERGHIHTYRQSIGMLAMAGISHGPFPGLKDNLVVKYFEADAARELFEFMDSESDISQKYRLSLDFILQHGIKLTLVGSMQDQVVPFYSAILSAITHPNIVRSVYIDRPAFTPENGFLIHLISFALGLRNAGLSDHGLLTHLSAVLAGSLFALEGGHSTIYEELGVYSMAVQHLFETYPLGNAVLATGAAPILPVLHQPFQAEPIKNHPYYLPWAMRGICEDKNILGSTFWAAHLDKLKEKLHEWRPKTAKLCSVKLCLEPFIVPLL